MSYRRELIAVLVGMTIGWSTPPLQAETTGSTITINHTILFTAPDGNDVMAEAGTYTVQPIGDAQLRLLPKTDQPSLEIQGASISHEESLHAPVLLQAISSAHTETISQATALLIRGEQEDRWHLVYLTLDGNRLDALGTTLDVSSRGISGIVGPKDRARFQDRMTPPGSASIAATAKLDSAVKAELQRLNAEQVRAKAELEPQALLARIKFLETILSCMELEGYGTKYGSVFPPPKVYPAHFVEVRWSGMRCPGK